MNSMAHAPRHTWVPYVAALAGAALTLKVTLILATGDGGPDWPYAVLYLGGLVLGIAAAVGAGLRQRGALRRGAVGLGGVLLLVAWIMGLGEVLEPVVALVSDTTYVQEEVPILVAGLVLLGLAFAARSRDLRAGDVRPRPAVDARSGS